MKVTIGNGLAIGKSMIFRTPHESSIKYLDAVYASGGFVA